MKVFRGFEQWNISGQTVASLGNYDGVHIGHQVILQRVIAKAREEKLPGVVITFDPIPRKVLQPDKAPSLIQTTEQRLHTLASLGIDFVVLVTFDEQFALKGAEEFVSDYLVQILKIRAFVVGKSFSFGHQRKGTVPLLRQMGNLMGFDVEGIPEVQFNGTRISSTLVRQRIRDGKMEEAAIFMGRPFTLTGRVEEGEHLGESIGIPTANLKVENEILPPGGVYITRSILDSETHPSVTNVGVRPTVGGKTMTVESHLLHFSRVIYGKKMEVQFLRRLRNEQRFSSLDELKSQIGIDISEAEKYFASAEKSEPSV